MAKGTNSTKRRVELLVNVEAGRTLLDLVGLSQNLETLLSRRVDVVSERGLCPFLRDQILAEAIAL